MDCKKGDLFFFYCFSCSGFRVWVGGNISGTKSVDCMYAFGCWARRCWAHVGKEAKLKIDSFAKYMKCLRNWSRCSLIYFGLE